MNVITSKEEATGFPRFLFQLFPYPNLQNAMDQLDDMTKLETLVALHDRQQYHKYQEQTQLDDSMLAVSKFRMQHLPALTMVHDEFHFYAVAYVFCASWLDTWLNTCPSLLDDFSNTMQ